MTGQIILTYFDQLYGPRVYSASPRELEDTLNATIINLLDIEISNGYFELIKEQFYLSNVIFEIRSPIARGGIERLMVSCVLDKKQKKIDFKESLLVLKQKIESIPKIYHLFSTKNNNLEPNEHEQLICVLNSELDNTAQHLKEIEQNQVYGQFLILGLSKVGKTSIIKRLSTDSFDKNIRPTLGTQMLRTLIENLKFIVYDVGGQKSLRKLWFNAVKKPDSIIYVIDLSNTGENFKESIQEFQNVLNMYFINADKQLPLLILGNKLDILPEDQKNPINLKKMLRSQFKLDDYDLNYHIGLVSALTNEGIIESFKWLAMQSMQ